MSDDEKRLAALEAAAMVEPGMLVGLGTGSTASLFVRALGARMQQEGLRFEGVCTSRPTEDLAQSLGIPLRTLDSERPLDLYVDGADEIDGGGSMIKGGGGALLREKLVALHAKRRVIVTDSSKLVGVLGKSFWLPVEVVRFGWTTTQQRLVEAAGLQPHPRRDRDTMFLTDEGNYIIDCEFSEGIRDPATMARLLKGVPGVVETGLFIGLCDELIVGRDGAVERRQFARP